MLSHISFESLVAFVPPAFYVLSVSSSSIEWMYSNDGLSLFPYPLGDVSVMWNLRGVNVDK